MLKRALFALCLWALLASHASAAVTFISGCGISITEPGTYHLSQIWTAQVFRSASPASPLWPLMSNGLDT